MPNSDNEHPSGTPDESTLLGIARGLRVNGDIKGSHDLLIEGRVTGSVYLPDNRVLVAAGADVHANIVARIIEVAGTVVGNLQAADYVVIRGSSTMEGDILAPQIQLEEGCQFKGSVQMREPDIAHQPPSKPRVIGDPGTVRFKSANG